MVALLGQGGQEELRKAAELYEGMVQAIEEEGLVPHLGDHLETLGMLWIAAGEVGKGKGLVDRGRRETREFDAVGV